MVDRLTAKEIESLRCSRLTAMSDRLTAKEIESLRCSLIVLPRNVYRVAVHMLHLHDIIQRLQNLQPSDITPEELEAVTEELPGVFIWTKIIAAACRGMLREDKGDG